MAVEEALEVLDVHFAIFVGVNYLKSFPNIRFVDESLSVQASADELLEVYHAITVHVTGLDHLGPLLRGQLAAKLSLQLLDIECPCLRLVKAEELLLELLDLLRCSAQSRDEREHNLLELIELFVLYQVFADAPSDLRILLDGPLQLLLEIPCYPGMVE